MRDTAHLRVWEIAGASHVDAWIGTYGAAEHNWTDTGAPQSYSQVSATAVQQGVLLELDAQDIDRRVKSHRARWPASAQGDGDSDAACTALSRGASAVAAEQCRSARVVVVHPRLPRHARLLRVSVRVD